MEFHALVQYSRQSVYRITAAHSGAVIVRECGLALMAPHSERFAKSEKIADETALRRFNVSRKKVTYFE